MATIVVCGGGVVGSALAAMLAHDGHQLTVLEADPAHLPTTAAEAWASWPRPGVAQFHQPHALHPRVREVCDQELPGLTHKLLAAGCVWVHALDPLPATMTDRAAWPGDQRFASVTGRRAVVEAVIASMAADEPGVTVHRGVRVAGLLTGPTAIPHIPHIVGVHTTTGERIRAELVIDATGRKTRAGGWLAEVGARPPQLLSEDNGFVYYSRYFTGPTRPQRLTAGLTAMGTISIITAEGDNDTWSVTIHGSTRDHALKTLRNPEVFNRVLRASPLHAHWLDGQPITNVLPMAGIVDCYRRFVLDHTPIATGFLAVADAWACTNPSAARGCSVGLAHAQLLRRLVATQLDRPGELAATFDHQTQNTLAPFYWSQVMADRERTAEMNALREGRPPPPASSSMQRLARAANHDPDLFRALVETLVCLTPPDQVITRPDIAERIHHGHDRDVPPPPDRAHLLELLTT